MRIGLVIYGSLDTVSGGYLYDRRLVQYLRAQGDAVEIVSLPWGAYARRLAHNLDTHWVELQAGLPVDVLLQDELAHPSLAWGNAALRRRASFPLVAIVHHLRASERHPRALMPFYRHVERRYLQSLDGFVHNAATTRAAVEQLRGKPAPCVVATPAGDRFLPALGEDAILRKARQPGALRLVYVGNVIARKGLHTVLEALGRLRCADWRLDVSGDLRVEPGYARRVQQLAQPFGGRVKFWGGAGDDTVRALLAQAHVLVMPSSYEGFGIVYLEGMSFGLPALGTLAGSAREIIQDGVNGFLIAPGDAAGAARALDRLIADRDLRAQMALSARRRFAQFPGWDESMRRVRDFLLTRCQTAPSG